MECDFYAVGALSDRDSIGGEAMIIDAFVLGLSGCSAGYGVICFLMGGATHMTEWYLKAIFAILFAHYIWDTTK